MTRRGLFAGIALAALPVSIALPRAAAGAPRGAGRPYVADYEHIQDKLCRAAQLRGDRLTAGAMAVEMRSQTQQLAAELGRLRIEIASLQAKDRALPAFAS